MTSLRSDLAQPAVVRTGRVELTRSHAADTASASSVVRHTYARPVVVPVPRRCADAFGLQSCW